MLTHTGELAALLTTVFWTITALAFENASKRIGSLHVNLLRLALASVYLAVFSWFYRGMAFPADASAHTWLWLVFSGIVGFVIGDYMLFQAFVVIGARIAMLMMTLSPVFSAAFAYFMMGERMAGNSMLAMLITLTGIALVVFTRTEGEKTGRKGLRMSYPLNGILLGLGAAACQGIGLVFSKYGMGSYDPFAASHIRVMTGFAGFAILFTFLRKWSDLPAAFKDKLSMKYLVIGSVFGPFLGVSFSLLAVQHTNAGIAQTIMSLVPVFIIPPAMYLNKERPSVREVIGAVIAVSGVALFFI